MSFQDIPKVESADTYLDIAFRRGRERAGFLRQKKPNKRPTPGEIKFREVEAFRAMEKSLSDSMGRILDRFPQYETLSPFYKELMECSFDLGAFRKSLGAVSWAKGKIGGFHSQYSSKISRQSERGNIMVQKKMFYGRVASVMKQIKNELRYLEECRKVIRKFPIIKEGVKTAAIFGFPNVGKTTLLSKLTESTPEIAAYPFTTKSINLGYLKVGIKKVQLLDTPGTLNRFDKMNDIERQAYLAIKHVADLVIYVFDLTEPYPIDMQLKLYRSLKEFNKPVMVYFSKTDIIDRTLIEDFSKKIEGYSDVGQIRDALVKL